MDRLLVLNAITHTRLSVKYLATVPLVLLLLFANDILVGKETRQTEEQSVQSFEGTFHMIRYVGSGDRKEPVSGMEFLVHPDHISITGVDGSLMDLMGNIRANGIIVNHKSENLVLLTDDQKAVSMDKQELRQMFTMLENLQGNQSGSIGQIPDVRIEKTDHTVSIQGHDARKWEVENPEDASRWNIWITEDFSVPWGMLSENWLTRHTFLSGFLAEEWLHEDSLPLRIEFFSGDRIVEVLEIANISWQSLDHSRFQIPENYQQLSFQEILFNRMRNR